MKFKYGKIQNLCLVMLGAMSGSMVLAETAQPSKSWTTFFSHADEWQGKPHVEIMGIIQPTYTDSSSDNSLDTFSFTRARVGVRGTATESISYWFFYAFENGGTTAPVGGASRLLDAKINWAFSDYASLGMGQFIPDFAQAIQPGAFVNWIDYTDIEKTVYFFNRQGDTQTNALRELGMSLWKEFRWGHSAFNYEIGIYNGAGLQQVEQTDDDKDIILGARYAYGSYWVHGGYWTGDRDISEGETVGKDKYSATLGWGDNTKDKYWLFGEYLKTTEEQPGAVSDIDSDGFYIAAGWRPTKSVGLVYRYSECDCVNNIGAPGRRDSTVHTITATYFIQGQMKILAQYDVRDDDLPSADSSNAFRISFNLPFSYRLLK